MSHPYINIDLSTHIAPSPTPNTSKIKPIAARNDRNTLSSPCACPMAAFSGFYESPGPPPSGDARGIVPPHHDGHWNGHQSGCILHLCIVCCRPGGRLGDMEWVVAQWRHPVASGVALDMLHWVMLHVSLQKPPHGHWNGVQRRHICLSLSIFCMTLLIAKDHVMVH